ncbi:PucR family transcriptional regulator [Hornefia butyriciproducens]|uniref:PucR C-terminal helix-turn-helix domain-containing protein n=1 Tax=Hornefia butyriciproducens TaxID=2652293 RepID=A0A6L5Y4L5_9FIRM|nr:helix-turn-helix domain-containing protein [Hornefia butyriciproducens]MST51744.1 hypothetical protein [Hornefia butyriciproducens]
MSVHLAVIKDELNGFAPEYIEMIPDAAGTRGIRWWKPGDGAGDPRYLYIAEDENLLEEAEEIPGNLIFCSEKTKNELGRALYANMLVLRKNISVDRIFPAVARICEEYSAWDSDLCTEVMEERSLDDFMAIAIQKLKNPIGIYDAAQALIYHSSITPEEARGTIWEESLAQEYPTVSFFSRSEIEWVNRKFMSGDKPVLMNPRRDPEHCYLMGAIRADGRQIGSIGMVDLREPITQGQLELCHRIGQLLNYIFKFRTHAYSNEEDVFYALQLIAGKSNDTRTVEQHLARLGWTTKDDYYMAAFRFSDGFTISREGHSYHRRIQKKYPKALIFYYNDYIITVMRKKDCDLLEPGERGELENFCLGSRMYCGVSNCFHDFMDLGTYFVQCSNALHYAELDADEKRCVAFTEKYMEFLLDELKKTGELRSLCDPGILALSQSDRNNREELLESIRMYLVNGRSVASTAREMFIHRNTLTYRLQTAENFLGVHLDDLNENEIVQMLLSCIIVRGK